MSVGVDIYSVIDRHVRAALDEIGNLVGQLSVDEDRLTVLAEVEPAQWTKVGELEGQSYKWPEDAGGLEVYSRFELWQGDGLTIGVGYGSSAILKNLERTHIALFKMGAGGGSKRPVVYFTETDLYAETGERFSPIRGKAGGRSLFAPGDQLPPDYDGMRIETLRDVVAGHWNVLAIIAKDDELETMLNHAAAQIRLRNL